MENHFLSLGFRLARGPSGPKKSCKSLTSRATCFVVVMYVAGTVLPASTQAQGLLDILFGSPKSQKSIVLAKQNPTKKLVLSNCSAFQQSQQGQASVSVTSKNGSCSGGSGDSSGFVIITAAGGTAGGVTATQLDGTHIAVSGTVGLSGSVTVPGGGSLTVADTLSVDDSIHLPLGTAPLSSAGLGGGMAMGSASSIGDGSADSSSFGNGDSLAGIANSGVFAGSSGGSGSSLGGGLGMGGGFGMSGSVH